MYYEFSVYVSSEPPHVFCSNQKRVPQKPEGFKAPDKSSLGYIGIASEHLGANIE